MTSVPDLSNQNIDDFRFVVGPNASVRDIEMLLERGLLQVTYEMELPSGTMRYPDGKPAFSSVEEFIVWQNMNYLLGNVVKHVTKQDPTTMLRDLRAAEGYLQREIQRLTDNASHQ